MNVCFSHTLALVYVKPQRATHHHVLAWKLLAVCQPKRAKLPSSRQRHHPAITKQPNCSQRSRSTVIPPLRQEIIYKGLPVRSSTSHNHGLRPVTVSREEGREARLQRAQARADTAEVRRCARRGRRVRGLPRRRYVRPVFTARCFSIPSPPALPCTVCLFSSLCRTYFRRLEPAIAQARR